MYYITQHALTKGILDLPGEIVSETPTMVQIEAKSPTFYHKPHWHLTMEEAVAQAEKMRLAKIASLEKQLAKLKALQFK